LPLLDFGIKNLLSLTPFMHSPWYTLQNIEAVDSPALVIYPDRVKENIRLLKSMSKGIEWLRPHVKTHKMAEVSRMLLEEGIYKFKCATIAEAQMLAMNGAKDVLLAYQPVGPKVHRLLQLVQKYPATTFSCLIDNKETAQEVGSTFAQAGATLNVFIDLNVGMNRTGIAPGPDSIQLYTIASQIEGTSLTGLHAYDGHLRETDYTRRKEKADKLFESVLTLADQIASLGYPYPVLVAGGSPTFPIHAQRDGVECSPGTFIFWDWGYQSILPEQEFIFAALLVTRIISVIDQQTLCLDLGHKSVAAENPLPRVKFLNVPQAQPVSQSEEHLVVNVEDSRLHRVGDVWYGVPVHICPTCALYEYAYVARNEQICDKWAVIARNRSISI
jgi:D-serine deaminase-like pyridoxal phosphate-dependent protein